LQLRERRQIWPQRPFARARKICERLGDNPAEYLRVMNWLHIALAVRGELPQAREAAGKLIDLAAARGDRPALLNDMRAAGLSSLLMGRIVEASDWLERNAKEFDDSSEAERLTARAAGQDAGAAGLAIMSWALWVQGDVDRSLARVGAALQRADALTDDHHTQAYVSHYASVLYALRGDPGEAYQYAERCFTLSEKHGFRQWRNPSRAICAVCATMLGPSKAIDPVSIELDQYRAGYHLGITVILALLCEALLVRHQLDAVAETIKQGLKKCEANTELFFEAELHRLKARALLLSNEPDASLQAQSLLEKALNIARSQNARSLELRAARDLAMLRRSQGKPQQARELLAPVYGWFTEGFDTRDLKEAKALLDELR
jgi:tetratricopeptide (TPR) repeat protein